MAKMRQPVPSCITLESECTGCQNHQSGTPAQKVMARSLAKAQEEIRGE